MKRMFSITLGCTIFCLCSPPGACPALADEVRQAQYSADRDDEVLDESIPDQIRDLPDVEAQMKVIHHRSQLIVAKSNITRVAIADSAVIDVVQYSPNELSVIGLSLGSTTVTLWFEDGGDPLIYLVEVIRDPSLEERRRHDYGKLERKLAILFPNSKVYLIPLSGKILVKGQARDSEEATRIIQIIRGEVINQNGSLAGPQPYSLPGVDLNANFNPQDMASGFIVNMLDVPGEFQVALRVRIAELNRSMLRRMGVSFSFLVNGGDAFFSSVMSAGGAGLTGGAAGAAAGGSTLQGIFQSGDIRVLIDALAANGTTKILAEPTLTVLSGHPASFLSGGEFAVPTIVGIGGVGGQQTTFRGFGVSLVVTPTILDKDIVRLQILPEFSQISIQNRVNGIPGTTTRRVQTTVELREGQTIALAGLMSHQSEAENNRIPLLGEIPIIGPLVFNSKRAAEDEKELLILVSPELVRPLEPDEVPPLPGYEVTHPDDRQLYLKGRIEGAPDQQVYQLSPYGNGNGSGVPVGYSLYNPAPAAPSYPPAQSMPYGPQGGTAAQFPATQFPPVAAPPVGGGAFGGGPVGNRYPVLPGIRRASATNQTFAPPTAGGYSAPQPAGGRYSQSVVPAGGYSTPTAPSNGPVPANYTTSKPRFPSFRPWASKSGGEPAATNR